MTFQQHMASLVQTLLEHVAVQALNVALLVHVYAHLATYGLDLSVFRKMVRCILM